VNRDPLEVTSPGPRDGIFLVCALQSSTLYIGREKEYRTNLNKNLHFIPESFGAGLNLELPCSVGKVENLRNFDVQFLDEKVTLHTVILERIASQRLGGVAHTCNPSYLGGRDGEDHGSRPAWGKKLASPPPPNH
jgi:hypothetical protein